MSYRIEKHPILTSQPGEAVTFRWQGQPLTAKRGETIAAALFANGIRIFGHHPKDGAPQGLFCANGQCSQCLVLADGIPVKACVTVVTPGMAVTEINALPTLPGATAPSHFRPPESVSVPALVLGGGPAGMSAAIELGRNSVTTLLIDDKDRLGGKLVLQTHRFFGSADAVYAGTRGIDIAAKLAQQVAEYDNIDVWLNSTALAVFSDGKIGILRSSPYNNKDHYALVEPQVLVVATGARERSLVFPGNTLPGVYGAGAFQTLVNRDLVRAAQRLFIVGGGNVGLIAGYHALQAGIDVVGLVEAMPECGGYRVHRDKLARLGVPIYTSHTVLRAHGDHEVESITIAQIDGSFRPIPGTERSFACDTVLVAVGLDPVDEFTHKARAFGIPVFDAGDAQEIAEASAAMFTGRIAGRQATRALGTGDDVPAAWAATAAVLRSHPGLTVERDVPDRETGVFPVFHCVQEIPCDPCTTACPQQLIRIPGDDIRHLPAFVGSAGTRDCVGCEQCVAICPGLAITLVDYRRDPQQPTVSLPFELGEDQVSAGDTVIALDREGRPLDRVTVTAVRAPARGDRTRIVRVSAPRDLAKRIASIRPSTYRTEWAEQPLPEAVEPLDDDAIVCRCERVTAGEIRAWIRNGGRDINELKIVTRAGMGACGGKTCTALITRLFREAGIPVEEVTQGTQRPLFVEVPLGIFAGAENEKSPD